MINDSFEENIFNIVLVNFMTSVLFSVPSYCISSGFSRVAMGARRGAVGLKVKGSIPNSVIGIFHWHDPSCLTMALGSTQPLTEMITNNISWVVKAAGA